VSEDVIPEPHRNASASDARISAVPTQSDRRKPRKSQANPNGSTDTVKGTARFSPLPKAFLTSFFLIHTFVKAFDLMK
jgi:hypothetical protein